MDDKIKDSASALDYLVYLLDEYGDISLPEVVSAEADRLGEGGSLKKGTPNGQEIVNVKGLFDIYCEQKVAARPRTAPPVLDQKRRRLILSRIRDGHSSEVLQRAIKGCFLSEWHMGKNKYKKYYDSLELILRDADHIERFAEIFSKSDEGEKEAEDIQREMDLRKSGRRHGRRGRPNGWRLIEGEGEQKK